MCLEKTKEPCKIEKVINFIVQDNMKSPQKKNEIYPTVFWSGLMATLDTIQAIKRLTE